MPKVGSDIYYDRAFRQLTKNDKDFRLRNSEEVYHELGKRIIILAITIKILYQANFKDGTLSNILSRAVL
jgi:adenylate cyclase class IV